MKTQIQNTFRLLVIIILLPFVGHSQNGTVKIFSEVKDVSIYLDEEFKGKDIILLNPVSAGSHYLKIIKENIIVYGELITVNENQTTTILVKDNKELREKILSGKYKEQQEYKERKLDILINKTYITETKGTASSAQYPGYYSILGTTPAKGTVQSSSTSVTKEVTDWFITEGGTKKISQYEFATRTNDTETLNLWKIYADKEKIKAEKESIRVYKSDVRAKIIIVAISAPLAVLGIILLPQAIENKNELGIVGSSFLIALGIAETGVAIFYKPRKNAGGVAPTWYAKYSMEDAAKLARTYNQKLKAELGLPEDFEPKE